MPYHRISLALLSLLCLHTIGHCEIPVPNASFEHGDKSPTGWTLNRGQGGLISPGAVGERAVAVTGDGSSDNAWISDPIDFAPNTVYRLQFQARRVRGNGGLPVSGPLFCNRDLGSLGERWTVCESFFISPRQLDQDQARLRFGQWEVPGEVAFDDVRLDRVIPVYRVQDGIQLGEGEVIEQGHYTFTAPLSKASANHSRPLAWHQCHFNSSRWVLSSPDSTIVYHHDLGHAQNHVTVQAEIGWYQRGELVVEASTDGQNYQSLGTLHEVGNRTFSVPSSMLPASAIWVRFSARKRDGDSGPAALQLYGYVYAADLDGNVPDLVGTTQYFAVTQEDPQLAVHILGAGDVAAGGQPLIDLQLENRTDRPLHLEASASATAIGPAAQELDNGPAAHQTLTLGAGEKTVGLQLPYKLAGTQRHRVQLTISGDAKFAADTSVDVPILYAADYGQALADTDPALGLWWCSSGWKVSVQRRSPRVYGNGHHHRGSGQRGRSGPAGTASRQATEQIVGVGRRSAGT